MGQDEKRPPILPSKYEIDGTLRNTDLPNVFARRAIGKDLSRGNIHIAGCIGGDTFAALFGKELQIFQCSVSSTCAE